MGNMFQDIWLGWQLLWQDIKLYVTFFLLGGGGGVSYQLMNNNKLFSGAAIRASFVSAFMGFLAGTGSDYFELSMHVRYSLSGLAGFIGGLSIIFIGVILSEKFGIDLNMSAKKASQLNETIREFNDSIQNKKAHFHLFKLLEAETITGEEYAAIALGNLDPVELLKNGKITKEEYANIMDIEPQKC